jgi:large subunit ribosomal protein L9
VLLKRRGIVFLEVFMKVLLCEDVKKLGWLGDIIEVKTGYARNYLLPQGIATVPSESNLKMLSAEKGKRAEQRQLERKQAEAAVSAVNGAEAVIAAKANEQGHLFGSVTAHQIAENLRAQGFEVSDDVVELKVHIKEVGTSEVELRFASDLQAKVNVVVVAEQETDSGADQTD